MRDDFLSADWAAHHASLSRTVTRTLRRIGYAFERLNAYEYDAPWRRMAAPQHRADCR